MKKISFVLCTIVAFFLLLNYTSQNTDIIHETKNDITKKSNTKDNIGKNSDLNKKSPFSAVKILRNTIYISFDDKKPSTWHTLLSLNNIGADALMNFAKTHYGERFCDYKIECYKFHIIKHIYKVYKDFQNEELPDHVPVELSEASVNQNGMDVENTHEKYLLNKKNFVENIGLSKNRNIRTPNGVVGTINHLPPNVLGTSGNTNEISK